MAAPRKLAPAKEAQVVEAYTAGKTLTEITSTFGISAGTVRSIAARAGVTLRPVGRPKVSA